MAKYGAGLRKQVGQTRCKPKAKQFSSKGSGPHVDMTLYEQAWNAVKKH